MPDEKTMRTLKVLEALTKAGALKWNGDIGSREFNAEAGGGTIVVSTYTEPSDGPHSGGPRYQLAVCVGGTVVVDFTGSNSLWEAIIAAKESCKFDPWIASLEAQLEKTS